MFETNRSSFEVNSTFFTLVIISIIVHSILLSQFKWSSVEVEKQEELIEVDLFTLPVPKPPPKIAVKQTLKAQSESAKNQKSAPTKNTGGAKTNAEIVVKKAPPEPIIKKPSLTVESKISGLSSKPVNDKNIQLSEKQLSIPTLKTKPTEGLLTEKEVKTPTTSLKAVIVPQKDDTGSPQVKNIDIDTLVRSNLVPEADLPKVPNDNNFSGKGNQSGASGGIKGKGLQNGLGGSNIEGEISNRNVIYKPDIPELELDRDVTIILRFTVLPNGEVDQVFPHQKADPELESFAIRLLHEYRFEPLSGSSEIQSGVIHFTILRKK